MSGYFTVDGINVNEQFGAFITKGGYKGLLQFPQFKQFDINSWSNRNGIEVDLVNPVIDSKVFNISVCIQRGFDEFMSLLTTGSYHIFGFVELGIVRKLRYIDATEFKMNGSLKLITLTFSDDFPLSGYSYTTPNSTYPFTGMYIDGIDLSLYGISLIKGCRNEIYKPKEVKQNLSVSTRVTSGISYDDGPVFFKERDVKLQLLMRGETMEKFIEYYNALLYNLTRSDERYLDYEAIGYKCYYKSMEVTKFSPDGEVWMMFNLILCFIES